MIRWKRDSYPDWHSVLQKHLAKFTLDTPRALYMSLAQDGIGRVQQHKRFIEVIRESVWSRIEFEAELPPSFDALWHHWQQTCWVSNMWNQAASNHMRVLDLTQYGWKIVDGNLSVIGSQWKTERQ